jgi:uncharacterized protein (DUF2141 family)
MKNPLFYFLLLILCRSYAQSRPEFTLKIENVKQTKGMIRVAFYKKANDFLEDKSIVFAKEFKVNQKGEVSATWSDVPYGEYAFAIYQDKNGNKKLDKNIVGYPNEPFAFSKNVKPKFAAPDFEDCKIVFSSNNSIFTLKLID